MTPADEFRPLTFPVNRGTKKPAIKWGKLRESVPVPDGFDTGIATGRRSGCVVLDLDVKNGKNGPVCLAAALGVELSPVTGDAAIDSLEALGALIARGFLTEDTRSARTASGGFHFYFVWPGSEVKNSAGKIAEGVDVRGDGGYARAVPSEGFEWLSEAAPWARPCRAMASSVG